jgi:acetylornithine deacetylase
MHFCPISHMGLAASANVGHLKATRHTQQCRVRTSPNPSSGATPLDAIDRDWIVEQLRSLIAIPSIGGSTAEVQVQEWLADRWADEGLRVDRWSIPVESLQQDPNFPGMEVARSAGVGVLAQWAGNGDGPVLLINGHTDVVPPGDLSAWSGDPFTARLLEGPDGSERIVGRGAADMKAGLVAAWAAVRALRQAGVRLRGTVAIAPVCGEEDGGLGTYALLQHLADGGIKPEYCVVPEPTSLDIIPANGGALTFRLTVRGRATHASRRSEGVSAVTAFLPILQSLQDFEGRRNISVDPLMQRWPIAYPLSIGTVQAGDWASTVPDLLIAEGRYGVALGEDVATARADFEQVVAAACADDPWLRDHPVEVQWWGGQFAPGRTDPDHPLIGATARIHRQLLNSTPEVYGGPYGSDLRLLTGIGGIPTIQYGPGDSKVAHAPDEWVAIDEVVDCARVLAALIIDRCHLADAAGDAK